MPRKRLKVEHETVWQHVATTRQDKKVEVHEGGGRPCRPRALAAVPCAPRGAALRAALPPACALQTPQSAHQPSRRDEVTNGIVAGATRWAGGKMARGGVGLCSPFVWLMRQGHCRVQLPCPKSGLVFKRSAGRIFSKGIHTSALRSEADLPRLLPLPGPLCILMRGRRRARQQRRSRVKFDFV